MPSVAAHCMGSVPCCQMNSSIRSIRAGGASAPVHTQRYASCSTHGKLLTRARWLGCAPCVSEGMCTQQPAPS